MELIPIISSQLSERPHRSPTWFELSPSYFLDRATIVRTAPAAAPASQSTSNLCATTSTTETGFTNVMSTWSSTAAQPAAAHRAVKFANFLWSPSTFRRALTSAANPSLYSASTSSKRTRMSGDAGPRSTQVTVEKGRYTLGSVNAEDVATPTRPLASASEVPFQRSQSAPPTIEDETLPSIPALPSEHDTPPSASLPPLPTRNMPHSSFTLGNMFISSCPGKKGMSGAKSVIMIY